MAKSAAALHILVKEEKLALEILSKLERTWQNATLAVHPGATAVIWVNSNRG